MSHNDSQNTVRNAAGLRALGRCKSISLLLLLTLVFSLPVLAKTNETYISTKAEKGAFVLASSGTTAPLCVSSQDFPGVLRVSRHLQADIERVTEAQPAIILDSIPAAKEIVIIGTLGKSRLLDDLMQGNNLNLKEIAGKWETFLIQVIENPFPNVQRALVIAGSDKRGTIYGMYDLSAKIGVSPWYWWADVPAKKQSHLYVKPGRYSQGEPKVKYRGIFINDEAPALSGWTYEKFGGFNSKFYEHVFELVLRLKGNYLWPAMWGRSLFVEDPLSPPLADEYGVVIGTSHHEPMMRAHVEWGRGPGTWNYQTNEAALKEFWREGIKRMDLYESIVTLGMRGDGDEPMTEDSNIALLQRIVKDQREILGEVTGKDVTSIPQIWALYKEVQEYYDKGMRVPDDVTLLLCDDNWGNIRKLPKLTDKPRPGGYGIYYHFDYVGGPRNYKWLNTNQISRVWEQMHLAYEYGVRQIWIVNVGDIKPMEFPIEFFLNYAWNPDLWPAERLPEYVRLWAARQFGAEHAQEIADILAAYTKFNSRRKPELLAPGTYSLTNYREAETVVAEYDGLAKKAQGIYDSLPGEYKDAFYQLVLHPVLACSNLNDLYVTVGKNRIYAEQGRAATNGLATRARELFATDSSISYYYNHIMANGKWNHTMDQTHIGYTYWQQPDKNAMPNVRQIENPIAADMGVAIEGSTSWWPKDSNEAVLPQFDPYNRQSHYIDLFNRGKTSFEYFVKCEQPWIQVNSPQGKVEIEQRLWVTVDWQKAPAGVHQVPITIAGPNESHVVVQAPINNPLSPRPNELNGFVENNGYVSIEAEHYSRAVSSDSITWQRIPDLGRTLSAMTPLPVMAPAQSPGGNNPCLEYQVYLFNAGEMQVQAYFSPTLNFHNNQGLRYGISFDDEPPQIINLHSDNSLRYWEKIVSNNVAVKLSSHVIKEPGKHVLKFWMVDPGVVLQKLVVDCGGVKPSYLGPPESFQRAVSNVETKSR
jgi:hypothetical protein